jgi:hypothetical protein
MQLDSIGDRHGAFRHSFGLDSMRTINVGEMHLSPVELKNPTISVPQELDITESFITG